MIEIQGLVKRYGKLAAVDRLSLRIPAGAVYGFLGPNGAGKTTTLKMTAGLLRPDEGSVSIAGVDMARQPSKAKALMAYIPDRPSLYPLLTGRETLRLVAGLYELPPAQAEAGMEQWLAFFGLANWADERVDHYSHGMRQKLMMAAALLHDPKVFILDEPMVGLDPQGARLVKDLFRRLAAQGTTVFVSMHTLEVAEKICDRLAILMNGRLLAEGNVAEIRALAGQAGGGDLEQAFLTLTRAEP